MKQIGPAFKQTYQTVDSRGSVLSAAWEAAHGSAESNYKIRWCC